MTNRRLDLGLATAFFGAALALRLPELMMVPRYSDEGFEVLWALDIATGRRLPLTSGVNNYYGPLFAYALAGLFKVFGTNIVLPRLTAAVLGALTTAVTYEFARLAWSRSAGIAAATLTAICPALILFAGHLGWSSSWTPFFVTAALTSLYAGVSGGRRFWLAASGMLAAAAIQTHPTSAVILVGIVLWLVALSRRQRLDWLGLAFAGGLVVLGCAPIFVIFAQAHAADAPLSTGIFAPTISLGEYGARLVSFVRIAGFFLAGAIGDATPVARAQAIVVEALAVASLFVCWKRGVTFVPLVVVAGVLALPLFVAEFDQRYYQFLFPAAYVALGILAAQALAALRGALRAVPALTVLVLSLLSVYALVSYFGQAEASGQTNAEYFRLSAEVRADGTCAGQLFVQETQRDFSSPEAMQSWYALHAVDYVVTLEGCPHRTVPLDELRQIASVQQGPVWAIVNAQNAVAFAAFSPQTVATIAPPPIGSSVVPVVLLRLPGTR